MFAAIIIYMGFPSGSMVKNPSVFQEPQGMWVQFLDPEDLLEDGCNPLQYSCLKIPYRVTKSQT